MNKWGVFIFAFVLYSISVFGGFVQDDFVLIKGDPGIRKIESLVLTWTRPYYYMQGDERSAYRPMTSFSFYVNALVTGTDPWGFRLVNVVLYGFVCVLIFELLKKMLGEGKRNGGWSFGGAILFAALPIHTEVVNNIVGRGEILSLIFILLAILTSYKKKWDLSAIYLFLGLLSKETAVVGVPILLFLIIKDHFGKAVETKEREDGFAAVIFVVMALVGFLFLRSIVLQGIGATNKATLVENPLKFMSTSQRMINAIALIPLGVEKIIFPVNLSYDYSFNQLKSVTGWGDLRLIAGLLLTFLSIIFLIIPPGRKKINVTGIMLFWLPIFVTGNILFPIGTIFGERLWFVPSLGLVLIGISLLNSMKMNRGFSLALAVIFWIIIALYFGRTVMRNFDWLNQKRLFLHDGVYASESVMAQSNVAAMYMMDGEMVKGKYYMERADKIYPNYPELLNNWGVYYLRKGELDKAKEKFEKCLVQRPEFELCKGNLEDVRNRMQ